MEVSDPDGCDPALGRLEDQLEDDDEPVTAVEHLEERLALAAEGPTTTRTRSNASEKQTGRKFAFLLC